MASDNDPQAGGFGLTLTEAMTLYPEATAVLERRGILPLRMWHNGSDTVIAFSPADASAVWAEHIGEAHADERHPWREWTEPLTADVEDGSDGAVTWTPAEWIAAKGRGFLCSEDR